MALEYVFLGDVNLQGCRGCYVCQSRGEQYCPINDERAQLVKRMQQADGVIFVSPVYTENVPALMKNLMDRLAYTAHRPAFLGKPAMLVATASMGTKDTLKALAWFGYTGFNIVSKLGLPVWPSPRRGWETNDGKLEKAVRRFEKALSRQARSLSLRKVVEFYVMKASADTDPVFFQADYDYHKAIEQLDFEVSRWKKVLGQLCYWVTFKWLNGRLRPIRRNTTSRFLKTD